MRPARATEKGGQALEQVSGNGCCGPAMGDVYRLLGWPEAVDPPGAEDWAASAVAFPVKFIC
jgi:hypothetical protein